MNSPREQTIWGNRSSCWSKQMWLTPYPMDMVCQGNLKVMSSIFGSGYVLSGAHPAIKTNAVNWNETVSSIRSSTRTSLSQQIHRTAVSVKPKREFFEVDNMGVEPPRRCKNCMKCNECSFRSQQLSQQEQYEYHVMESKVHYNESQQCFHVQYSFTDDPNVLPNNLTRVTRIAGREGKRLIKNDLLETFNLKFDEMIKYRALVELSLSDMEQWSGPVHYVSLQHQ